MVKALAGLPFEGFEAPPPPESGKVPDVVGLTSEEAQAALVEANFTPIVEKVELQPGQEHRDRAEPGRRRHPAARGRP